MHSRRNLQPFQRAELALKMEPLIAAKAKAKQLAAGERGKEGGRGHKQETLTPKSAEGLPLKKELPPTEARDQVAKLAGVGHDTLRKAKVVLEKAPEEVKAKLRAGTETINHAYSDIHRAERRAEAIEAAGKAERARRA